MITRSKTFTKAFVAATALALVAPLAALAQPAAPSAPGPARASLSGTIADFHGKYGVVVRDAHGALVPVQLHPGTVIQPTGLRLERGMRVALTGALQDGAFAADQIVAPDVPPPAKRAIASGWSNDGRHDNANPRSVYAGQDIPPTRDPP